MASETAMTVEREATTKGAGRTFSTAATEPRVEERRARAQCKRVQARVLFPERFCVRATTIIKRSARRKTSTHVTPVKMRPIGRVEYFLSMCVHVCGWARD